MITVRPMLHASALSASLVDPVRSVARAEARSGVIGAAAMRPSQQHVETSDVPLGTFGKGAPLIV